VRGSPERRSFSEGKTWTWNGSRCYARKPRSSRGGRATDERTSHDAARRGVPHLTPAGADAPQSGASLSFVREPSPASLSPRQTPLRRHPTSVIVPPTDAVGGVTLPPPHSDRDTVGSPPHRCLSGFEECTDPSAAGRVAIDMWPADGGPWRIAALWIRVNRSASKTTPQAKAVEPTTLA
jgi:hypothetical protein